MITNVKASNLKGRSFNLPLSQRIYITGPNYSGKTAIIEAIRLALLGHIPEIGKRNADSFELSSGSRMEVELTLDQEPGKVACCYYLEGDSVKSESNGGEDHFPDLPLLDAASYFSLTPAKQVDYVFRQVTMPPAFTRDGIIADLHKLTLGEEHTEAVETAKRETIAKCQDVLVRESKSGNLQSALGTLLGVDLPEEFKRWNARAKDGAGAVRTLTELKLREDECTAVTLTDLRNDLARIDGLIEAASSEGGRLVQLKTQAVSVRERRRDISAALNAEAPSADVPPPPRLIDLVPLKKAFDEATVLLGKLPEPLASVDFSAISAATAARQAQTLRDQLAREVAEKRGAIDDIAALECCPTCKRKARGWQKEVIATLEKESGELNQKLMAAEVELSKAVADSKVAKEAVTKANEQRDAILTATGEQQRLERKISAAQLQNEQDQRAYERMIESIKTARAQFDTRQESLRGELGRLVEVAPPTESEMEASRSYLAALAAQRTDARDKIRTAEALAHDIKRAEQAAEEATLATARATVIKAIGNLLKEKKAEMVAVAFEELLKTANALVGDILPAPLAYHEDNGDVGYWGDSGFIPHRVFSGTEKALAYVALAAALSSKTPLKVLILDELGRLTPDLQLKVMVSLSHAIDRKELDQCIVVVPRDAERMNAFGDVPQGWQIVATPLN